MKTKLKLSDMAPIPPGFTRVLVVDGAEYMPDENGEWEVEVSPESTVENFARYLPPHLNPQA